MFGGKICFFGFVIGFVVIVVFCVGCFGCYGWIFFEFVFVGVV